MTLISSLSTERRRWLGLAVVCMAQLMIVLDSTIVNVALPSIQHDLHFSPGNLTWVVDAFMVTFGSFLLVAGRLSDLLGRKRLFEAGLVIFTAASVLCGIAPSSGLLIAARFLQGLGAAMQASVILAIIVTEFPEPADRAKAMSAYVFTAVAGGSLGLLVGGVLTQGLSWHWIFFVNVPIGVGTILAGRILIPRDTGLGLGEKVDWLGSVLVTLSMVLAIYAIVQVTTHGWGSPQVLGFGAVAAVLMAAFLTVEARVAKPIMPLHVLGLRGLMAGSAIRGLLVVGMFSTFFLGTIYLERVLHYSAVQAGLAFLPWTLTVAALSLGVTARVVKLIGPMRAVLLGMSVVIGGLLLLTNANSGTSFFPTLFFAFFAIGFGAGTAFMPLMTMSMADVPASESGLASGITTLSQQLGGAFGIALLSTIATTHTRTLTAQHVGSANALVDGYHLAFTVGAFSVFTGIVLAVLLLRVQRQPTEAAVEPVTAPAAPLLRPVPHALEEPAPASLAAIRRRIIIPIRPTSPAMEIPVEHEHAA
ncbi:MAG: MFS transporter [Solirubrobacteraceae bacterium]